MKALLTILAMVTVMEASAQDMTKLRDGDTALSQAVGKITSVREICPVNPNGMSCRAVGSVVKIKVDLHGCLDSLGGYFTNFDMVDGKGVIYFSAINVSNKASMTARCVKRPTANVTVHVPFEGEIELINTNFTGMTPSF